MACTSISVFAAAKAFGTLGSPQSDDQSQNNYVRMMLMFFFFEVARCYHDRAIQWRYTDDGDAIAMARAITLTPFFLRIIRSNSPPVRGLRPPRATIRSPHQLICTLCVGVTTSPEYVLSAHARVGWIT